MARNRYQYETSPRKQETDKRQKRTLKVRETPEADIRKRLKSERKKKAKQTAYVLIVFAILLTISYRNSLINEKFNQVQDLKKQLATLQKENEQTEVNIQNSLNLNNIEQAAKEKLGMQKLTNKQTVYVNLPKKDYVEAPKEDVIIENENWIQKIINIIKK